MLAQDARPRTRSKWKTQPVTGCNAGSKAIACGTIPRMGASPSMPGYGIGGVRQVPSGFGAEHESKAWRALATLCSQGVSESTTQYFHLQQVEAKGMSATSSKLWTKCDLTARRMDMFRQAAHDLRGNVGVVSNVSSGLIQETVRSQCGLSFLQLLQRSVSSLHSMLDEVMDLTRLQAGQELADVKRIRRCAIAARIGRELAAASRRARPVLEYGSAKR